MQDPLFWNKVAGAALTALLIFFGLPQLAGALLGGHHAPESHDGQLALAYPVEFDMGAPAGGEEEPVPDLGTLLANASAASGERRAALCKSCHTLEKGGANSTGPNLWGVVDRPVASHAGFGYTGALKDFGGEWTYERLDHFLENSQAFVPGTAMVQRFAKPEQRADILAYLQTLSDSPVAFPEPAPPPEMAEGGTDEGDTGADAEKTAAAGDEDGGDDAMKDSAPDEKAMDEDADSADNPGDQEAPEDLPEQ